MKVITKRIAILFMVLFILVLLDVITTSELLAMGGTELNQKAVLQWQQLGFDMSVKLKIGMVLFLGFIMVLVNYAAKTESDITIAKRVLTIVLLPLSVFFFFVVANNTYWIFYARSLSAAASTNYQGNLMIMVLVVLAITFIFAIIWALIEPTKK